MEKIKGVEGGLEKDDSVTIRLSKTRMWQIIAGFFFITTVLLFFFPLSPFFDGGVAGNVTGEVSINQNNNEKQNSNNEQLENRQEKNNQDSERNKENQESENQNNGPQRFEVSVDDDPSLGDENAPVTIVAFEDYQCPFCRRVFIESLPKIRDEYIDTGKVKLVFRDFPLVNIHPESVPAAVAAECADEQGAFWPYHDDLFNNQDRLGKDLYLELASDHELDTDAFRACMESGQMQEEVQNDFNQGVAAGVDGTPAYFINGIKIVGSHPYENFKKIIDSELG